jgi:hypothetical protein
MPLLWRVTTKWTGGQIGSGFTNMFFNEGVSTAQAAADAVKSFFQTSFGISSDFLPAGVVINTATAVDVLEPTTGVQLTTLPVTGASTMTGTATGNYAAPAGACVSWVTSGFIAGHRVKGRTFMIPLAANGLENNGTLSSAIQGQLNTAAAALIASAPEFVIWHRPSSAAAGDGATFVVLAHRLQDKVAMLTSRR